MLVLISTVLGFGTAILDAGFNSAVAALPRSSQLLNYLHGFFGVGALLGPLVASALLTRHWPWQSVYLVWSALSLPLLLGCLLLVRSLPMRISSSQEKQQTEGNVLRAALRLNAVWLGALFLFLYVGMEISIGSWNYSFSLEAQHLEPWLAGWIASGYWLGLTLGRFLVNAIVHWLHLSMSALMYSCLAGIALGLVLIWLLPTTLTVGLGFVLIGLFLGPLFPTTIAFIPGVVPTRLVSSAIGFLIGSSVVGGALFPWMAGTLAQSLGIWTLLPTVLILTMSMCPIWWRLTRYK